MNNKALNKAILKAEQSNIYEKHIWVGSVFPMYYNPLALAAGKATRKIYK